MNDHIQYAEIFTGLPGNFRQRALELFHLQYKKNNIYQAFVNSMGIDPLTVRSFAGIPFLPISFFKTHAVQTGHFEPEIIFESSGTTGQEPSKHLVRKIGIYRDSFLSGFRLFYGDIRDWCIIGLLPSYLERSGSSLVYMVKSLIDRSGHPSSGFYLNEFENLNRILATLEKSGQRTLLIGVTFGLLDFAEAFPMRLRHTVVMETGGMKGRRREMTRAELHQVLRRQLSVADVHAEYGMTELLSQAYSMRDGQFQAVPWMKVMIRSEDDPLEVSETGDGLLNIIDLANTDSCAFIATDDVGRVRADGSFEVLGRTDNSDIRGCSLLAI
jgi:Acyl-protein synthetase, LuxE